MSQNVPTGTVDARPLNRVLAVIPGGVLVLTVVAVIIDVATGALHF
ncbi:hypothetical protein GCM10009584_05770 [Ornithinimicrobium humiphilum]|jgi:hypothetical protein|uniref:Uncharacterized protein n=1 Tax=Ornithinimicrobium humiphilum TaxID=125288 RepID=A0A543KPU0_9MICO|nr:hypothetical protein [Ornithinimicrobium humiphilum]TQM97091.1 hypothetical protein FB476_1991 [Ornithinimicrobium humiphilum]